MVPRLKTFGFAVQAAPSHFEPLQKPVKQPTPGKYSLPLPTSPPPLNMVLPHEPEFEQALNELTQSLGPFLKKNPEYKKALEIVQIPERVIQFRVVWEDDQGNAQVNRGFRVQVSTRSGPGPWLL